MLWVVGAPARLLRRSASPSSASALRPGRHRPRAASTGSPRSSTRSRTSTAPAGSPPTASTRMSSGGIFGQGIGASQQKWGALPEAHTDFIFAVLGEELGLVGTLLVIGLFLTIAYAALRIARETKDPFVRYTSFGIVVWLHRPDDHQRRHGARAAARHRHPAAAGVLRRVQPAAHPGRARPARRLRPARARGRAGPRPAPVGVAARPVGSVRDECGSCSPEAVRRATPRRCSRPPTPCDGSTPSAEITCLGTPRGLENKVVPAAGYPLELIPPVPLPAPPQRRPGQGAGPAARRGEGDARDHRPGPARRHRRLRRLRVDAGLPRRAAPQAAAGRPRAERAAGPGQQGRRAGRHPGRGQLPGHQAPARPSTSACRSAG